MKPLFLAALGGLAVAAAAPAQAAITKQTVGPVSFSGSTTPSLSFAPFSASAAANLISVSLTSGTGTGIPTLDFGGVIKVINVNDPAAPVTYGATAAPSFKFNNAAASTFTGTTSSITFAGNPLAPPSLVPTNLSATGTYGGTFTSISTVGDTLLQNYFAGSPKITMFNPSFNTLNTTPLGAGAYISNTLSLTSTTPGLYLTYTYDDPTLVPGPLPIAGAGVAFGLSRKLRRRIKTAVA